MGDIMFFDITQHKMACSAGDFSSLYDISHINGQIIATFKRAAQNKRGTEIFIKNILPDVLLQDILEFVFPMGQVYQIRILLEFSGHCRGYCYVNFFDIESARKAMIVLCGKSIRNHPVMVKMSFDNNRLEIPNISKNYSAEDVFNEISKHVETGLQEAFFVRSKEKNRVNCILVFDTHRNALQARKELFDGFTLFGERARIDWAVPEERLRSKRLYFNIPLPKLTKPELYEELIKVIEPKCILNIFLQQGVGYITLENEYTAYEFFKVLKNTKICNMYFNLSWKKFYDKLPNTTSSVSEYSDTTDNQMVEDLASNFYSLSINDNNSSTESLVPSATSSENNLMPLVPTYSIQPILRSMSSAPVVPLSHQIPNTIINYNPFNPAEHYQICGVPYPSPCDCWTSQFYRQNQFTQHPIRIIQINSDIHQTSTNFFQMTQDFYKHFYRQ